MKKLIVPLAAAILAASSTLVMAATELKFAHAAPETDMQQNLATFFAEQVKERTKGEVTVKIFPHGQLGNDQQKIISEVAAEATAYQRNLSIEKESGILEELAQRGMEINKDVDKAAFQEAVVKSWDSYTE